LSIPSFFSSPAVRQAKKRLKEEKERSAAEAQKMSFFFLFSPFRALLPPKERKDAEQAGQRQKTPFCPPTFSFPSSALL